ncbi:MAG: hypothetical protein BGO40_07860 [Chryseobacterium sp. 39-10]|nr:DUF2851 family protein [Chryseobacterium sp.]OJV45935.1 MAG: hypothetical protein BGO40_07860 [Chryseobacterium sp. 39-10]
MTEKLLQYLWNFKIFKSFDFTDVEGNPLEVIDFGRWNFDSGPDFLYGKIRCNGLVIAGNIELHVKSSDWVFHHHSGNPEFDNVILHVVFLHDVDIAELTEKNIPTLELKAYIDENLLQKYESLLNESQFIPCEKIFDSQKIPFHFFENALLRKLDEKSLEIDEALKKETNDYEAVLFQKLAYAFGLKVNAPIFRQIAEGLDYTVVNKVRQNRTQLEALFYGISGWLDQPFDEQMHVWKREFEFLKTKFHLTPVRIMPKFSKLRPPNFPTIRFSQLASLYSGNQNLFSKLMTAKNATELYCIFENIAASSYWNNHFNFGKLSSVTNEKKLTKDFVDIVLLNAVLPLRYTYYKNSEEAISDEILDVYRQISAEKNTVIAGWKKLKLPVENALHSQGLLFHYQNFCEKKACLQCGIGLQLMKK